MALYFDESALLPCIKIEYVAWVDVMGTQATMSRSLSIGSNFMGKLHMAAFMAPKDSNGNINIYPVMDGFYVTFSTKEGIELFLQSVLRAVANEFINTKENRHRFVVRGALAYGPVVHGGDIPREASRDIANNPDYAKTLLLGMPMVQANGSERFAPPFGVYIHESARSFAPPDKTPFRGRWWNWERQNTHLSKDLKKSLDDYYDWCQERTGSLGYEPERIDAHRLRMRQYFADTVSRANEFVWPWSQKK